MSYKFTSDWFLTNQSSWDVHLESFKHRPNLNFLEIGSYEGILDKRMLENVLTDPGAVQGPVPGPQASAIVQPIIVFRDPPTA